MRKRTPEQLARNSEALAKIEKQMTNVQKDMTRAVATQRRAEKDHKSRLDKVAQQLNQSRKK